MMAGEGKYSAFSRFLLALIRLENKAKTLNDAYNTHQFYLCQVHLLDTDVAPNYAIVIGRQDQRPEPDTTLAFDHPGPGPKQVRAVRTLYAAPLSGEGLLEIADFYISTIDSQFEAMINKLLLLNHLKNAGLELLQSDAITDKAQVFKVLVSPQNDVDAHALMFGANLDVQRQQHRDALADLFADDDDEYEDEDDDDLYKF